MRKKPIGERVCSQHKNFTACVRRCWLWSVAVSFIEKAGLKMLFSGEMDYKSQVFESLDTIINGVIINILNKQGWVRIFDK